MARIDGIYQRRCTTGSGCRGRIAVPSRQSVVGSNAASSKQNIKIKNSSPNLINKTPSLKVQKRLSKSARVLLACERLEMRRKSLESKKEKAFLEKVSSTAKKFKRKQMVPAVVATLLVGVSVYSLVDTWLLNSKIKDNLKTATAAIKSDDQNSRQSAEGQDEKKVSANSIDLYKVAADLPRVVKIDKIGARARVLQMGVNADGSMQAPINIYDAGWYTGSVKPGQLGATNIIAHANGPSMPGLFDNLDKLVVGDEVSVENGAGKIFKYQVVAKETVALDKVDMNKFIRPADGVNEGLNLMTCTGSWVQNSRTRDHRIIVYTKRIQ